jgi:hypothetical protein
VVGLADINQPSSTDFTVVVTYNDDHRLDTDTFDNDDIILSGVLVIDMIAADLTCAICIGPTGPLSPKSSTFVAGTGNQFVVTYTFSPPNGQWSAADGGVWSVEVAADQVGEYMTMPQYVPARTYGTFAVKSNSGCRCSCSF